MSTGPRTDGEPLDALAAVRDRLVALEVERVALVALRQGLVTRARAEGATWAAVTAAAGVSRPALLDAAG